MRSFDTVVLASDIEMVVGTSYPSARCQVTVVPCQDETDFQRGGGTRGCEGREGRKERGRRRRRREGGPRQNPVLRLTAREASSSPVGQLAVQWTPIRGVPPTYHRYLGIDVYRRAYRPIGASAMTRMCIVAIYI